MYNFFILKKNLLTNFLLIDTTNGLLNYLKTETILVRCSSLFFFFFFQFQKNRVFLYYIISFSTTTKSTALDGPLGVMWQIQSKSAAILYAVEMWIECIKCIISSSYKKRKIEQDEMTFFLEKIISKKSKWTVIVRSKFFYWNLKNIEIINVW